MSRLPTKAAKAGDAASPKSLTVDLAQIAIDIAGVVDPTPISDGTNAVISVIRGNWLDAAISVVSIVPYVGDLAKAGKLPRYLRSLEKAVELARRSADARKVLQPVIDRVAKAVELLPADAGPTVRSLRAKIDEFYRVSSAKKPRRYDPPDVSTSQFRYTDEIVDGRRIKTVEGRLGVPGKVKTHRSGGSQSKVSSGTGDHAGHLVGDRFGAVGDARNLTAQNWKMNVGSYKKLENLWARKLKSGTGIEVKIKDVTKPGDDRSLYRQVEWTEIEPSGRRTTHEMTFGNFHTAKSREMRNVPPTNTGGRPAEVIDIRTRQRLR